MPQASTAARPREHWSRLATAARPRLAGLRFGEREQGLSRLAAEFTVNPQTLRRALAALKFVEQLEAERFARTLSLRNAPVAAVEHVARWYAYDRAAALQAARQLAAGEYTVAALGAAESAARTAARPDGIGRSLIHRCRLRVGPVLAAQFADLEMDRRAIRRSSEPSVDFRFRRKGAARWSIVAIIMGPYRDQSRYALRLGDWIVKTLGLAAIYERAILVVPAAALKKQCLAWMRANALRAESIEIQVITPEP